MKKIIFSLIALIAVMSAQAQSLCSTWRSMQPVVETADDDSFTAQNYTYTFKEDGTFYFVDEYTMASQPSQTMALEVATTIEIKGTYVLVDNQLTLTPDKDTYKTELLNISMNGRVTNDPKVKSSVNAKINDNEFKKQFTATKKCFVKIGNSWLEMKDGEQTLNFVRFATIDF